MPVTRRPLWHREPTSESFFAVRGFRLQLPFCPKADVLTTEACGLGFSIGCMTSTVLPTVDLQVRRVANSLASRLTNCAALTAPRIRKTYMKSCVSSLTKALPLALVPRPLWRFRAKESLQGLPGSVQGDAPQAPGTGRRLRIGKLLVLLMVVNPHTPCESLGLGERLQWCSKTTVDL